MSYLKSIYKAALLFMMAFSLSAHAGDEAGKFDYYVLSLSWSPEYCSVERTPAPAQCEKHYGFVVHGLWPQNIKGYPQFCGDNSGAAVGKDAVPDALVQKMLPIMPGAKLIQHEWEKHGTCSGKDVGGYFDLVDNAFAAIHLPADLTKPDHQVKTSAQKIRKQFAAANPGMQMVVACKGKFLQEVRICLNKDANGSSKCSKEVKDTCPKTILVRPVR